MHCYIFKAPQVVLMCSWGCKLLPREGPAQIVFNEEVFLLLQISVVSEFWWLFK